jgi:hypothetical protein
MSSLEFFRIPWQAKWLIIIGGNNIKLGIKDQNTIIQAV